MDNNNDNKSSPLKKEFSLRTLEELRRKKEIQDIIRRFPSILQITSIGFKDTESVEARPTVRCVNDISIKDLISTVIHKEWKLKSPRIVVLIMSNVGSVPNWSNPKQIKSFQKGLMKAAENTNMWLITNGIDMGATTIIGNAVPDYISETRIKRATNRETKFNFIGIADEDKVKYMTTIETCDELKVEITNDAMTSTDNKYRLNKDLSHYIIIKDKTEDKNGVNSFLERLTKFLSLNQDEAPDGKENELVSIENNEIPVVSLIIKGGYGCALLVSKQIANEVPVVVLKGTGGLADLLAFVDMEVRDRPNDEWDKDFDEIHLKPELTNRITNLFPKYRLDENLDELYDFRNLILKSVRNSRTPDGRLFLTVINLLDRYTSNLENLSEILLSALFKTQQTLTDSSTSSGARTMIKTNAIRKDLALCIDWNCPEVAKKEVLTQDQTYSLNDEKRLFEESLIRENHCEFVDLFLSQKFRLRSFVTPKRIKRMFRKIHSNEFFSTVCWEGILGRSQDIRQSERFIDRELNWLVELCTGNSKFLDETELSLFVTEQYPYSEREAERKALEILVFWAILHFRKRLVRILWRNSDRPINLALIIAMSYDRLSLYISEQSLNDELKAESKQFVAFSLSVLDKCYRVSAIRSDNVLNEAPKDWNYNTSVDLAAFGHFRGFFSHPSCQRWLTNKFYGNIAVNDNRLCCLRLPTFAKILMSTYLVLPIYWWIRTTNSPKAHLEEEVDDEDDDENQIKKKSRENSVISLKTDDKHESNGQNPSEPTIDISSSDESKLTDENKDQKSVLMEPTQVIKEVLLDKTLYVRYRPPVWTLIYEVWTAPITKFWNFQLFYIWYLATFCFALLSPKCGNSNLDKWVAVWTILLIIDDCRQTYILRQTNPNVSITTRLAEIAFKCVFVFLFCAGRLWDIHILSRYQEKVLMSWTLLFAFITLLSKFLPISSTLGPLLYRLKIMLLVDFMNFIRLSILVMVSFGVIIQAVIYPDHMMNGKMFQDTFHRALFTLFLTPANDLSVEPRCSNLTVEANPSDDQCISSEYIDETCRNTGWWPYIFMISYLILLKLILMTVLFALFASSASKLSADTDTIWKFQRYGLVLDFDSRTPVPPPMNIFYYLYIIIKWIYCLRYQTFNRHDFIQKFKEYTLYILSSKSTPLTRHLTDDEYNYFKLLASETFDDFQLKISAETLASLQWERIQALSEEFEFQRQYERQTRRKVSEMDRKLDRLLISKQ